MGHHTGLTKADSLLCHTNRKMSQGKKIHEIHDGASLSKCSSKFAYLTREKVGKKGPV